MAAMSYGWNTSPTRSTPSRLFDRSMLSRDVAGFLSTLDRVAIGILLIRRAIVLAAFLGLRFGRLFPRSTLACFGHTVQDAGQSGELPGLCVQPEFVFRQPKHGPPHQPIHRNHHERHNDGGQ